MHPELSALHDRWAARWEDALACWSRPTRLSAPRFCFSDEQGTQEGLTSSFAMIRFVDHAVVVSLADVRRRHLERFALEILAHEVGHHVYCPGDLVDLGRMLARARRGLPTKEHLAGLICNLYTDLHVNTRLARFSGLDIAGVYRALRGPDPEDRLWTLYLGIYEQLLGLPRGDLARGHRDLALEGDIQLGAALIRTYARDAVAGAGTFAALCLPYLLKDDGRLTQSRIQGLLDTAQAGQGADPPDLASLLDDEETPLHPSEDPRLGGDVFDVSREIDRTLVGGKDRRDRYRGPVEYGELVEALGIGLDETKRVSRYYEERARPHVVRFPTAQQARSEPLLEGLDIWDAGDGIEEVSWTESVFRSPHVIPGLTTRKRVYGEEISAEREEIPGDLYIGIDCSGSMPNPKLQASYPTLAGTILTLSALRVGARVKIVLSGEPGRAASTDGFVKEKAEALRVLTDYLGTGYAFGIHRLSETFDGKKRARPTHVVIITDFDVFSLLDKDDGWGVAERSLKEAGGTGTFVLRMPRGADHPGLERMRAIGYRVFGVHDDADLPRFAREFGAEAFRRSR